MRTIKPIIYGLMLLAISGITLAEVVYYENFENATAVSWPSDPEVGLDPNDLGMPWSYDTDPANGVVVIDNAAPGAFEGSNYLRMERTASSWYHDNYGAKNATIQLPELLSGHVSVSFAFMHPNGELGVILRNSDSDEGIDAVNLWFGPTGYISYTYFGVRESLGLKYAQDEWNYVRIDADFSTYTLDLYLNGVKVENVNFSFMESGFDRVYFMNYGLAIPALVYLDSIKIETGTPECAAPMRVDMNGDCKVDMQDFVAFAASWLKSNIHPED